MAWTIPIIVHLPAAVTDFGVFLVILVKRVVVLSSYSCFVREINLSMRSFDDIYWQNFSLQIQVQLFRSMIETIRLETLSLS